MFAISLPCLLSLHILRPAGLLLPLFLPQDIVNALSDLLGFFHFPFSARYRRLSVSLSAVSLAYSAREVLPISKSKGRGASPLPLRCAPVLAPVCAALLCWMGGIGRSRMFLGWCRNTGRIVLYFCYQ